MCNRKRTECEYTADLRKTSNLRSLTAKLHAQIKDYEQALLDLRTGTLLEASHAFQNIRGADAERLLEETRETFKGPRLSMAEDMGPDGEGLSLVDLRVLTLKSRVS